jgi:hypothetical protein
VDSLYFQQLRFDGLAHLSDARNVLCGAALPTDAQQSSGEPYCLLCIERAGQLEAQDWVIVLEGPGLPKPLGSRQRPSALAALEAS